MPLSPLHDLPSPLRRRYAVPLLLALLTLLVYANSFPGAFIQDDLHIVKNNPLVADLDLIRIFTSDYWLGLEHTGLYRPLTILSLALNRLLLGESVWGFHLVNVVLHAVNAILLWLMLRRWEIPWQGALLAAVLFAIHPIHSEVVNMVVGRSELLVACSLLLALLFARRDDAIGRGLTMLFFAAAMLAKENAIVFLAILPLVDVYLNGGVAVWRQRWPLYAGLCGVALAWFCLKTFAVIPVGIQSLYSPAVVPLAYLPWDSRVLTALQYQWVYLAKLFAPWHLQAAYSQADLPPIISSVFSRAGFLVLVMSTSALLYIGYGWRRWRLWALFFLLYLISFIPTANIFLPIGVTFAERLAYFPSIWFCAGLAVVLTSHRFPRELQQRLVLGAVIVALLVYSAILVRRNSDFANELRLWSQEVRINSEDYLGLQSYAEVLNIHHRYEESESVYKKLLALQPEFQGALRSYVAFLVRQERFAEALPYASRSLRRSEELNDKAGFAYDSTNLAHLHIGLGEFEQALVLLQRTSDREVAERDYYLALLGRALSGVGQSAAAVEAFSKLQFYRADLDVALHYGLSLLRLGKLDEARVKLTLASDQTAQPEAWNGLGTVLAQQGQLAEAEKAFRKALEMAPDNHYYRENLEHVRQLVRQANQQSTD